MKALCMQTTLKKPGGDLKPAHLPRSLFFPVIFFATPSGNKNKEKLLLLSTIATRLGSLFSIDDSHTMAMAPQSPLVPALQSQWLFMHVNLMILRYPCPSLCRSLFCQTFHQTILPSWDKMLQNIGTKRPWHPLSLLSSPLVFRLFMPRPSKPKAQGSNQSRPDGCWQSRSRQFLSPTFGNNKKQKALLV
jgi:hypothetical protein